MSETLTITVESKILELAEKRANAQRTTVEEMLRQHLEVIAQNHLDSALKKTPVSNTLRGVISDPKIDPRTIVEEELSKKYGG